MSNNKYILQKIKKLFVNYKLISLGFSCRVKKFINIIVKQETHLFDWLGVNTNGILNEINTDFKDFFNKQKYIDRSIEKGHTSIVNPETNMTFIHDNNFLKYEKNWKMFKNKYTRRINRFIDLLKSKQPILFICLESNRKYQLNKSILEQKQMFEIVKTIKKKYNKHNFKILYFSCFLDKTYYNNNIIFIKTDHNCEKYNYQKWSKKEAIPFIHKNYNFISNILDLKYYDNNIKLYKTIDNIILIRSDYDIQKLKKECNIITNLPLDNINKNEYNHTCGDKYPLYLPVSNNTKISKSTSITVNGFTDFTFKPTKYLKDCPYIRQIIDSFNTKIYYVYISKLYKRGKIVKHKDIDVGPLDWLNMDNIIRFHIPIITNPGVDFFIKDITLEKYYLEEGNLYYIRAGDKLHWVENNSDEDRYHLIIDLKPTKKLLKKIIKI